MRGWFVRPLSIGPLLCRNNLFLAPMAGITDAPFRLLCLECGAGLVEGEMVSAEALKRGSARTGRMLGIGEKEHPSAMQIFGSDPASAAAAANAAQEAGADAIDINCGCPVKKIIKTGAGAVLMKNPALMAGIIAAVVRSVSIPVTVKMRAGIRKGELLSPGLAEMAEAEGASAVIVHARYAEDFHSGPVELSALEQTCRRVKIPLIGNGGVDNLTSAAAMFETGCRGVMIGRAAIGNPGVFAAIAAGCAGGRVPETGPLDRLDLFENLLAKYCLLYGERTGINRARKTAGCWLRGFEQAANRRAQFMSCRTLREAKILFSEIRRNRPG